MVLKTISYVSNYADINARNKAVCIHPSIVFEDEGAWYIIHLTSSTMVGNEIKGFIPFKALNVMTKDKATMDKECYISYDLAIVSKKGQLNLKENKKLKFFEEYKIDNLKELLSTVSELLKNNYFKYYNGYFKRSTAEITGDFTHREQNMINCLQEKIKTLL